MGQMRYVAVVNIKNQKPSGTAKSRKGVIMKWTKGYYTDNNGNLYELKEKVSTGFIFWVCEWIYSKGIVRTERTAFFSNSDIKRLKLN